MSSIVIIPPSCPPVGVRHGRTANHDQRCGYRRRHAALLANVLACGGYFLRRQVVAATQQPDGGVVTTFLRRLVARGYAQRGVVRAPHAAPARAGCVFLRAHRGPHPLVPTPRRTAGDRAPAHDARHRPGLSRGAGTDDGRGKARILRLPARPARRPVPGALGEARAVRSSVRYATLRGRHRSRCAHSTSCAAERCAPTRNRVKPPRNLENLARSLQARGGLRFWHSARAACHQTISL